VVKVIDRKAALPPHMDGLVAFTRLRKVCTPCLTHASLARPSQYPKGHLDHFSHFCTADNGRFLYFAMRRPFPLKITLAHGRSGHPTNTCFHRPTPLSIPNGILISSVIFAGLTIVIDRLIDRPYYSVFNIRPHLCT